METDCEESVACLIFLIPIPLVNFRFGYFESGGERDDLLLAPVGVANELLLKNLFLVAVHSLDKSLAIWPDCVAASSL